MLHGPFSALYPGNAIGSAVQITTHKPEKREALHDAQRFSQHYDNPYGFAKTFGGNHRIAHLADKVGRFWCRAGISNVAHAE
jgi:iron complex outermembrane receptor protein